MSLENKQDKIRTIITYFKVVANKLKVTFPRPLVEVITGAVFPQFKMIGESIYQAKLDEIGKVVPKAAYEVISEYYKEMLIKVYSENRIHFNKLALQCLLEHIFHADNFKEIKDKVITKIVNSKLNSLDYGLENYHMVGIFETIFGHLQNQNININVG
jgi:hypothetical protein